MPNKQFGKLINISPHSLTMMNTVNTELSSVEALFTDQAGKALEIEDNVNFNTNYWIDIIKMRYSTEPKYTKYVKRYGFLSFPKKFGDKYGKKLMDTATKPGIDDAKTASKRVVQKTAEATRYLIGNKIADKITSAGKSKGDRSNKKSRRNYIPPEKKAANNWWLEIILVLNEICIV